jgi:two-component system OmpR family sensor kinase
MSLRLRLVLALAPLFVLGLCAADIGTYKALETFLVSRVDDQLIATHTFIEVMLEHHSTAPPSPGPPPPGSSIPCGTWAELLTTSRSVEVAPSLFGCLPQFNQADKSTHPVLPASVTSAGPPSSPYLLTVGGTGGVSRYRLYVEAASNGGLFLVAAPLADVDSTLSRLLLLELGITGGVMLVVVAATWLIVRRGLRPLVRMGDTARSIVATDLSRRVTPSTERTEVGRLGIALNTMLGQLEAAFAERAANEQRLRHFVSDASHELRTPLTSMQGYAELLQRNPHMDPDDLVVAMRRIAEESRRMGVLVDELLLLARLDQGRPLERRPVDLEALVTDACGDARAAAPDRAVTARIAAPLIVLGDDMRLRQVMGNVVRNALVHTPAGTPIEVELRSVDGRAVIEVVDHGRGIPPGHAQRIFDRFHRADPDRSGDQGGSGLGLSIAAAVVIAHGGRIGVDETPGGGARFRIELPMRDADGGPAGS